MQVVHMHATMDGFITEIIRLAMNKAGLDAAARQKRAKAFLLMFAAMFFDWGRAGERPEADDQRAGVSRREDDHGGP